MGGLISLHLLRDHPAVFGLGAALSPSLWWDNEKLLHAAGDDPRGLAKGRLWVDMGSREGHSEAGMTAMVRRAHRLAFHLRHRPTDRFRFHEEADGRHDESAWAARFPDVLRFLFPAG
jgi:predicted alpha/beta superfamily hydrolase